MLHYIMKPAYFNMRNLRRCTSVVLLAFQSRDCQISITNPHSSSSVISTVSIHTAVLKAACESHLAAVDSTSESTSSQADSSNRVAVDVNESGLSLDISAISAKRRLVEKILKSHGRTDDDTRKLDIKISSYLACKPITASAADDAMLFWKTYAANFCAKYPTLQHVARCYLSISASSVPVKSMFSTTGLILNSKRSSLVPHKLNYITFIHDNCC